MIQISFSGLTSHKGNERKWGRGIDTGRERMLIHAAGKQGDKTKGSETSDMQREGRGTTRCGKAAEMR